MSSEIVLKKDNFLPLFVNIGLGNHLSVDDIRMVLDPEMRKVSGLIRRIRKGQENGFRLIELFENNKVIKSVILLKDNSIILSILPVKEILSKMDGEEYLKEVLSKYETIKYAD